MCSAVLARFRWLPSARAASARERLVQGTRPPTSRASIGMLSIASAIASCLVGARTRPRAVLRRQRTRRGLVRVRRVDDELGGRLTAADLRGQQGAIQLEAWRVFDSGPRQPARQHACRIRRHVMSDIVITHGGHRRHDPDPVWRDLRPRAAQRALPCPCEAPRRRTSRMARHRRARQPTAARGLVEIRGLARQAVPRHVAVGRITCTYVLGACTQVGLPR
jgi:hypothetical protein